MKAAGEGAVLARRAAGALRNVPNMPRCSQIVISAERRISLPGIKMIRSRILPPEDTASVHGIPATSGERTLLDLAEVYQPGKLGPMVDFSLVHGFADRNRLEARAHALTARRRLGPDRILALLEEFPVTKRPIGSEFELGLYRILLRAGLELPTPQYEVQTVEGPKFIDFAYWKKKLALEADSYLWHSSRRAYERDRARSQELIALGWRVPAITRGDVSYRPDRIVDLVTGALAASLG